MLCTTKTNDKNEVFHRDAKSVSHDLGMLNPSPVFNNLVKPFID